MASRTQETRGMAAVLSRAIGAVALTAARRAKTTLLLVLLTTAFLGYGATQLTTNVDVADVLPRGDYNTTAAHELTDEFKSAFTMQVTLQFSIDESGSKWTEDQRERLPFRRTEADPSNITDEVYIRAMAEAVAFIKAHDPLICCVVGVEELFKLINWTLAGGEAASDASWALPGTDPTGSARFDAVDRAARAAIPDAIDALSSPSWRTSAILFTPSSDEEAGTGEIGRRAIAARDAYVQWAEDNPDDAYQVFTGENRPLVTVEIPVANAHSSQLTKEDFGRLLPIIAVFILAVLAIAFRNTSAVLIAFSALTLGTLWTYGIEGYMGIALNPLNLTLMPLIMGIGIDYSIHVTTEFQEHKSKGLRNTEAFREVGKRAGMALFIATLTTVIGLLIMIMSPSVLIAQFGALASLSIVIMLVLVLTYIPAALTLWPSAANMGASFRPSAVSAGLAAGISRVRVISVAAVLVLMVVGSIGANSLYQEAFGDPGRNYLKSDPVRQEHEAGLRKFYDLAVADVKANVITFKGDLTDPQAHRYMRSIEAELVKQPRVISDTLRTIPFLMETWLTVKGGGPGAVSYLAQGGAGAPPYPVTADEIRAEFNALYASPVRELGSIFTNGPSRDYTLGVMTFSVRAATYEEAEQVWHQVWSAIGNASKDKPRDLQVAFVGNTATNYLFVAKEVPWIGYMGAASNIALAVFLVPFFRSWRAFAAIMLVNFATTAWWLGVLPVMGIGLAITLVLPLIFISAIGTDYAVHLAWAIKQVGDPRLVWETTGKAIMFSWITTVGPFLIFTQIQDLSVRKTMIATAIAISIVFVVTLMVMPAFYPVGPKPRPFVLGAEGLAKPPSQEQAPMMLHESVIEASGSRSPGPVVAAKRPKQAR